MPTRDWFRRTPLREAIHAAGTPGTGGWRVVGPNGTLAEHLEVAVTPLRRMRGLLGHAPLRGGEALVLQPCNQIHTFGLRFPIDAVFCDRELRVVSVRTVEPNRLTAPVRHAWCCFELAAGTADDGGIELGNQLELVGPEGPADR